MRVPDPKANTTTEAYLAYKAGYLEESELKPSLYEPYLHFDAWLAYWAGLTSDYPKNYGKNLCQELSGFSAISSNGATDVVASGNSVSFTTSANGRGIFMASNKGNNYTYCPELYSTGYVCSVEISATKDSQLQIGVEGRTEIIDVGTTPKRYAFNCYGNVGERVVIIFYRRGTSGECSYIISNIQVEKGSEATDFEEYSSTPEMLTDEEALVAYLAGVTDTYPEDIKDPYDVRIVGYLRHLASIRWPEPDYPVNNEEFYLSTMEPTHTSNPEPSADIELDTVDGNIISVEAYGDTFQQTYSGKNLMPMAISDNTTSRVTNFKISLPAGTYTISFDISDIVLGSNQSFNISMAISGAVSGGGNYDGIISGTISSTTATHKTFTFTTTEDSNASANSNIRIGQNYWNNGARAKLSNIQIEAGSEASSFEPYVGGVPAPNPDYPQDVHTVTGEQTVRIGGKNLWKPAPDGTSTQSGITSVCENGVITLTGTSTNTSTGTSAFYDLDAPLPAGTYTYSVKNALPYRLEFVMQDSSGTNHFPRIEANSKSGTITTTWETVKIRNGIGGYSVGTEINLTIEGLQLEAGLTATEFQSYQTQSYTVDLGTIELCKIGDYQDYIYKSGDNWYVHKDCGKIEFDGSNDETWSIVGSGTPNFFYAYDSISNYLYTGLALGFICSAGVGASIGSTTTATGVSITNIAEFRIRYGTEMTLADWKSYLSSTPMSVYYRLATPTDTQLTDATLVGQLEALANADTYNEKTYIKVTANDPNLPALLKVEAYKY